MDDETPDIGELDNKTVFVPNPDHADPDAEFRMQMGRGSSNDLRDPWFHTDEGRAWLDEQGEG